MRVGLISCSATKLDRRAPAEQLYTGHLFTLSKEWIQQRTRGVWAILSAKHGLVLPWQELDPYDLSLDSLSAEERRAWAARVHDQILRVWDRETLFTILAGADYRAALTGLPYVEDVINDWTERRRQDGLRPPHMGIGVLKRKLLDQLGR